MVETGHISHYGFLIWTSSVHNVYEEEEGGGGRPWLSRQTHTHTHTHRRDRGRATANKMPHMFTYYKKNRNIHVGKTYLVLKDEKIKLEHKQISATQTDDVTCRRPSVTQAGKSVNLEMGTSPLWKN